MGRDAGRQRLHDHSMPHPGHQVLVLTLSWTGPPRMGSILSSLLCSQSHLQPEAMWVPWMCHALSHNQIHLVPQLRYHLQKKPVQLLRVGFVPLGRPQMCCGPFDEALCTLEQDACPMCPLCPGHPERA